MTVPEATRIMVDLDNLFHSLGHSALNQPSEQGCVTDSVFRLENTKRPAAFTRTERPKKSFRKSFLVLKQGPVRERAWASSEKPLLWVGFTRFSVISVKPWRLLRQQREDQLSPHSVHLVDDT